MLRQIQGYVPEMYSAFCPKCKQVREVSPSKLFCEVCEAALHIHVKVDPNKKDENIVVPILASDIIPFNRSFEARLFSFEREWRHILHACEAGEWGGLITISVEKHMRHDYNNDAVFLELVSKWEKDWSEVD